MAIGVPEALQRASSPFSNPDSQRRGSSRDKGLMVAAKSSRRLTEVLCSQFSRRLVFHMENGLIRLGARVLQPDDAECRRERRALRCLVNETELPPQL